MIFRLSVILCLTLASAGSLAAQPMQAAQRGEDLIRRSAATTSTTSSPGSAAKQSMVADTVRVAGSLVAVLGLIVLMYWGTRRMLPQSALGRSSGAVHVLAKTHLSPKQKILLIQVGRRVLVVADGGSGQLNTLCEIDDPDEAAALIGQIHGEKLESSGHSFASLFSAARERLHHAAEPADAHELDDVESARRQLDGLMQQVRGLTQQIDRS